MSNHGKCSRCEEWFEPDDEHDFQHLEERKVDALERLAASLPDTLEKIAHSLDHINRKIKATPPRVTVIEDDEARMARLRDIAHKPFRPIVDARAPSTRRHDL